MSTTDYKIILDLPSEKPALAFDQQAKAFKEIIEKSDPRFAIGLFGTWGSGKTTLMQAIEKKLNKDLAIPVWFSAWRYEKEEHLIVPLLDEVRAALASWATLNPDKGEIARKTAATIGKVARSLLTGFSANVGVPGVAGLSFSASQALAEAEKLDEETLNAYLPQSLYHASFQALRDAFGEFAEDDPERRIVVFVDDLDRCLPEGALQVLESMKLFFDLSGFIFVAGLDQRVVEWLIDTRYGESEAAADSQTSTYRVRGRDYIKKIFQVPYALAPVGVHQLGDFLKTVYGDPELPAAQLSELEDVVARHLEYVVTGVGVNPREIKRYINSFTLAVKVKPNLKRDTLLALQTIRFQDDWKLVQAALDVWGEAFAEALKMQLDGQADAVENLDAQFAELPPTFLTYVSEGQPGHELLSTRPLDEYIYTGEATSSQDPALLQAISTLGMAKQTLREAHERAPLDVNAARSSATSAQLTIEQIFSEIGKYASTPLGAIVMRDLDTLREYLNSVPKVPDGLEDWHDEQQQRLNKVQGDLLALRRYSSLER